MEYSMYLDNVRLPVTPGKLQLKVKNQNETVTLLDGTQINLLKAPGLTDIELEALLPQTPYSFAVYENGYKDADFYLGNLKELKKSRKPFLFKVTRTKPSGEPLFTNEMQVSLEDYTITESADDGNDVMVAINLKEYKFYGTQLPDITIDSQGTATVSTSESRPAKEPAKTYTVKPGDKLWDICKVHLGDGRRYPEIAKLNGIPNPDLIIAGQVIRFE